MPDRYGRAFDQNGLLQTEADLVKEARVRLALGRALECQAHQFADNAYLDGYLTRSGFVVGLEEIKCRTHPYGQYDSVWLNVRKWLALTLGGLGMGLPSYFAVGWSDGRIGWVPVSEIDGRKVRMGGQAEITLNGKKDKEPVIDVPIGQFRMIGEDDAKA